MVQERGESDHPQTCGLKKLDLHGARQLDAHDWLANLVLLEARGQEWWARRGKRAREGDAGGGGLTWGTIGHFSAESRSSSFALEVIFEEVGLWWSCSWRITCSMSIDEGGKKEDGKERSWERRKEGKKKEGGKGNQTTS